MSRRFRVQDYSFTASRKFLIRDLRESELYLADEGWHGAKNKFPQSSTVRTREDAYCVMIAAAGFNRDELTITEHENTLFVAAGKPDGDPELSGEYPRGHFGHPFEKRFALEPDAQVKSASFENGLLRVEIQEQLEPKWPRRIDIRPQRLTGNQAKIV